MSADTPIDAETVRQIAALNGLDLPLERAEALIPGLQAILAVDAQIAALDLGPLTAVGLPWGGEMDEEADNERR